MSDIKRIAIIGAMDSEITNFKGMIENIEEIEIANIIYYKGTLCGKNIVLLKSGIGKVNAAIATTIAIERFNVEKIIFTGVAGSGNPDYDISDIVISKDLIEHDFDTSDLDGEELTVLVKGYNKNYYPADASLIQLAKESAQKVIKENKVYIDTIATGDQFVGNNQKVKQIHNKFKAGAIEMEGAAVAHAALMYKVPFVVIRSLSDKADSDAVVDFPKFVVKSAQNSMKIVVEMLENMK
ncbi:5'-methylthioadenosine/S-adenosylhomocysteine nucleosidase [Brachyspira hampsonii]|uniref:adenosylhomocysteine nucleosidase n=1 Tax=Brachyspira hampsonii TaxID=1287055 RepID=A0AAC9XKW2_9SPIR|nr:5'-methylthioadenosine/adenosylhomocysteine nucleosidase [Brachyspira hampsonii]ASJ22227.1 5'-methylthioadenosine/S-adenosylhomocysteine nucleosidase [Brachyspira hampsonii]MBW5380917.1 5'-methylthioadenosine/adenosylhomocysteine nucleosidase [Brachyspira hampsonii]OEJ19073.1 5'-methylthioadenosine/S-adenosylhomocysteine nucleosidase [Brachyspira hampsonii]